jgi:pimeloyl-ACP methyl ester carboxylesterase
MAPASAQQYAKRYPAHTRLLVLDSVAPNRWCSARVSRDNLEAALKLQFARCVADAACKGHLGDPSRTWRRCASASRPATWRRCAIAIRPPANGAATRRSSTTSPCCCACTPTSRRPAAMLPLLLHDAAEGRYEGLLAQSRMLVGDVSDSMMIGMQLSVICTEDAAELRDDPTDADTVLGTDLVAFSMAQCAAWPKGTRPAGFREPLAGKVPVLAISGEFDPVTPPRYGDEAIKSLPNGRHLVLPGQGHKRDRRRLHAEAVRAVPRDRRCEALDAACLKRLKPTPPFAGNYGWEP